VTFDEVRGLDAEIADPVRYGVTNWTSVATPQSRYSAAPQRD
jgi:hypothetical protein